VGTGGLRLGAAKKEGPRSAGPLFLCGGDRAALSGRRGVTGQGVSDTPLTPPSDTL